MSALLYAIYDVPYLARDLLTGPNRFYVFGACLFYLFILFASGKVINILRDLFVLADVILGVVCYFKRIYAMVWICMILLFILAVVRLFLFIIFTIRDSRRASRIERKALEKAEQRRGQWSEKRGYSGDRPPEEEDVPERRFYPEEAVPGDAAVNSGEEDGMPDAGVTFTREQAVGAARKLRDLKELGILTPEEFELIKARLYARLD